VSYYWKTLSLDEYNELTLDDYNLLELDTEDHMSDIVVINSGEPIYNGSIVIGIGSQGDYFQYYRDRAITKPVIDDIDDKYDDRFPFYEPTG
jgi:hypothetical protein